MQLLGEGEGAHLLQTVRHSAHGAFGSVAQPELHSAPPGKRVNAMASEFRVSGLRCRV